MLNEAQIYISTLKTSYKVPNFQSSSTLYTFLTYFHFFQQQIPLRNSLKNSPKIRRQIKRTLRWVSDIFTCVGTAADSSKTTTTRVATAARQMCQCEGQQQQQREACGDCIWPAVRQLLATLSAAGRKSKAKQQQHKQKTSARSCVPCNHAKE